VRSIRFNQFLSGRNVGKTMHNAVSIAFIGTVFATAAATFSVSELPNLGGGITSSANSVNDKGDVVGGSYNLASQLRSTAWLAGGAPGELAVLPDAFSSEGLAASSAGVIVGRTMLLPDNRMHATLWSSATSAPIDLGTLGGMNSQASGVNAAGDVVGNAMKTDWMMHAVLWPATNRITIDLGTLTGGHYSEATAINTAGDIVGNSDDAAWTGHATLWKAPGHVPVALQTLGGTFSAAYGINDRGDIVGFIRDGTTFKFHATLWPAPGYVPVDLGTLGGTYGAAYGINAAGDIVGYSGTALDAARHATLWSTGAAVAPPVSTCRSSLSLRSDRRRLTSAPVAPAAVASALPSASTARVTVDLGTLPGGTWSQATSINALGQIVGVGQNATLSTRAMFWKPASLTPPPTTLPPAGRDGNHQNNGEEDGDC
jgi:probable HAF family extracellular repeat protein